MVLPPEMYVERPGFVEYAWMDFVRGRPAQPADAFVAQIDGVVAHDASAVLERDRRSDPDHFWSTRPCLLNALRRPLKNGIARSELVVFDHLSHAGLHEDAETFNGATLDFLLRQRA